MSATTSARRSAGTTTVRKPKVSTGRRVSGWLWTLLAVAVALCWIFPVYWMVNSSFLSTVTLQKSTPMWLPFGGSWDNFKNVFADGTFVKTLSISLGVTLLTGRFVKVGLVVMAGAMVGILSPLVLFADQMWGTNGPTLLGQYVFKDIVLESRYLAD